MTTKPARPRTPAGPDVVSLGDIAVMLGKDKSYAQWLMSKPGAPPGTQTSAGKIRSRAAVVKFIETWEPGWHPSKGPRGTCDQGHTLEVRDDGTRIPCRICDVRRHKSPAVREANAAGMRARRAAEKRQRDEIQQDEQGSAK